MKFAVLVSAAAATRIPLMTIGEAIRSRPNLMQVMSDVNQWDNEILGLVDKSYGSEQIKFLSDKDLQDEQRDKDAAAMQPAAIQALVKSIIEKTSIES